jgi:hypothetical protein
MNRTVDGLVSPNFCEVPFKGNFSFSRIPVDLISAPMNSAIAKAPRGDCACWGIPFRVGSPALLRDAAWTIQVSLKSEWIVFMHTSDVFPPETNRHGFISPMRGQGRLGELAAEYVAVYEDGSEERLKILRRHHLGSFQRIWGENCFEAVPFHKPFPIKAHHEQGYPWWGKSQTRVDPGDEGEWINWLWAWQNPSPQKAITSFRLEPKAGVVLLFAVSAGDASSHPLRWQPRSKVLLTVDEGFQDRLDQQGRFSQIQLDMGQIISAVPQPLYPKESWQESYNNKLPEMSKHSFLIEYTAHDDACFHLANGSIIPLKTLTERSENHRLFPLPPSRRRVILRAIDKKSREPVPVKLHIHGEAGEYLAPVDRHRLPNDAWFEDYSVDFVHAGAHYSTYIPGETRIDLPLGNVYIEVSKGFEINPIRRIFKIEPNTEVIEIEIERVLPWRERGWVTADTHVHFLSPISARLEGSAEGINVVNLLASQWGELMTNVGDFDGKTTWGSREAGGDGEHLVRVGTENRQHVLGHISLLGYRGAMISPMTTGGPDESALGDPIETLLTEWARQCRQQGGLVVLPHFPNPRAEHAAAIVSGYIDAIEMTSWGFLYDGINPYSLSDWYRYLNCGYQVAAVGGTDKMTAGTAVGTVRTYAHLDPAKEFTYETWMEAVRQGETFVTYGPLLEFYVEGKPMGSRIAMKASGGTVDVNWEMASIVIPMSRVELVVNGEIRESVSVDSHQAAGHWAVKLDRSSWLALLVRGQYPDKPEVVAAHSSAVMVDVGSSGFKAAADAVTILEQIEGALAYLDTIGTRAESHIYKRMRLTLESAHRKVHNQLHAQGYFHEHTPPQEH